MKLSGRLASDFFWVAASQIIAALGQLLGVRILTEALSPAVFGEVSLMLGAVALATTTLLSPTMQALLRFHPVYAQSSNPSLVEHVAIQRIKRFLVLALPLSLPLGFVGMNAGWISFSGVILLLVLVAVDGMRMFRTTIMNAARQHHRNGIWQVGEAWGRPLLAYLATAWWGIHTEIVLTAFIVTSIVLYGLLGRSLDLQPGAAPCTAVNEDDLLRKFETYSRPLIPLGLLGWVSGMADRYMIGGLLSVQDVGMYAAAYGLASRPMLMLSSIAETTIRPAYYSAIGRNDPSSRKYLLAWFAIVFSGGVAACVLFALFHQHLARLLLGPEFREASYLMPWIVAGYGVLAVYHIPVRVCLAHDAPRAVTITEAVGAVLAVVVGFIFIKAYGLLGAAIAAPIYFGMQLVVSIGFAIQSAGRDTRYEIASKPPSTRKPTLQI
jgi:O-antigen/teichoic acid export membrane protein